MQTHIKEATASLVAGIVIIGLIHAGIWFTLFGTPDFQVLGFPFHYFWFVAGAPFAMIIAYWIYFRYITMRIQPEKDEMQKTFERTNGSGDAGAAADSGGEAE